MKIKKIFIMLLVLAVVISSAYMIGVKCGKQDAYSEVSIETKSTGYKYGVISSLAKEEGNRIFSAVEWFKAENIPKHNIVAFGKISFPNSNYEDYEEHEKKPYVIFGYVIDADGKVYCGDYSDGERYEDIYYSLLSEDSIECVGDIDEKMLTRINKAAASDDYYDTEWDSVFRTEDLYSTWSCGLYLVRHRVNNRFECINMYNDYGTSNVDDDLMDIGRDVIKYLKKLYCDKYNETSSVKITPDI